MRISDWSSDVCSSDLIQVLATQLIDFLGELLGGDRRNGAHIDNDLATMQPAGNAIFAEQYFVDLRGIGQHQNNDVSLLGHFLAGTARYSAVIHKLGLRRLVAVCTQLMPDFQIGRE